MLIVRLKLSGILIATGLHLERYRILGCNDVLLACLDSCL